VKPQFATIICREEHARHQLIPESLAKASSAISIARTLGFWSARNILTALLDHPYW
jgi:hypothetical protein